MWLDGAVTLDRFAADIRQPRVLFWKDGHAYSIYPIATALLITPLYAPAALVVSAGRWETGRIMVLAAILEKLAASLIAASSVACFYWLARHLAGERRALVAALAYAFATETWTVSSQALWQHGTSELAVIASLCFLVRLWERPQRRGAMALAGLSCALAVAFRSTNVLFLGAVLWALIAARRKLGELAFFLAAPAAVGAALVAYNLRVFGKVAGWYPMAFDGSLPSGLAGLLLSPGRGLLVYTPILLFSIVGLAMRLRSRTRGGGPPVYLVSALFSISLLLVTGKWRLWWGGHCYGPRLLTDILPCLMILMLPALELVSRAVLARTLFVLALLWSTFVQTVGAFCYPGSRWDETPVAVGDRPARLWDWKDSPLARSLSAGPRLGPDAAGFDQIRRVFRRGPD